MELSNKASTSISNKYISKLGTSQELINNYITLYQEIMGMWRWKIEIGQVDIHNEVSLLSSFKASPTEGHLDQLSRIIAFLKKKNKINFVLWSYPSTCG